MRFAISDHEGGGRRPKRTLLRYRTKKKKKADSIPHAPTRAGSNQTFRTRIQLIYGLGRRSLQVVIVTGQLNPKFFQIPSV